MNNISLVTAGNRVNISLNNKLYTKDCGSKDNVKLFVDAVLKIKADPTEENINELYGYLNKGFRVAKENGLEYNIDTGEVFFEDFNTPVPQLLVEAMEDYHDNGHPMEAITNFWKLLMANPDVRVRDAAFKFITQHGFVITDNGYLVVYKTLEWFDAVVENLQTFVTNQSYFVRKHWRKSPKAYTVYKDSNEDGEEVYKITKNQTFDGWDLKEKGVERVGNLGELEKSFDDDENKEVAFIPQYCTWHPNDFDFEKEKVVLGVVQRADRSECDSDPSVACSFGLHVGAESYVKSFSKSNTSPVLVCFVNPMNIIAVPNHDNSKMRVSEYYPYAIANRDANGEIDTVEQKYFEHDYIAHEKEELEAILERIKNEERAIEMDDTAPEDTRDLAEIERVLKARVVDLD
jgi:hypothetical protein